LTTALLDRLAWVEGQVGAVRSVAPLVASLPPDDVTRLSKRLAASTGLDPTTVRRDWLVVADVTT